MSMQQPMKHHKMKHKTINIAQRTLPLLVALIALCGCESSFDPSTESGESGDVSFTVSVASGVESRASLINQASEIPATTTLGVFGYISSVTRCENRELTLSNGVWGYEGRIPWSYSSALDVTYFAYAPYSSTSNVPTVSNGVFTKTHSMVSTVADQSDANEDLMVALAKTNEQEVPLVFNHALSALRFKLESTSTICEYTITAAKLWYLYTEATLNCDDSTGAITWSDWATDTSKAFELTLVDDARLDAGGDSSLDLMKEGDYMLALPQTLPARACLTITINKMNVYDASDATTEELNIPLSGAVWECGNIYTYTINVDNDQPSLDVSVEPWVYEERDYTFSSTTTAEPEYWIDVTTSEIDDATLQAKIESNLAAGITDMVIVGDYADFQGASLLSEGSNQTVDSESIFLSTTYTKEDGTIAYVTSVDFSSVTNMPTALPTHAFAVSSSSYSGLESIILPDYVEEIGQYAFFNNTNLKSIDLNNVTTLQSYAFRGCSALTEVDVSNITSFGTSAFSYCSSLITVTGYNATEIPNHLFNGCSALTDVGDMSNITSVGTSAFNNCTSLTALNFTSALTSIGSSAFEGATKLSSIGDVSGVVSVGSQAFWQNKLITELNFSSALTTIDYRAFSSCTALASVGDTSGVTTIGNNAFSSCSSLTSLSFPKVTSVDYSAFYYCSKLSYIYLPSATYIGSRAFKYMPSGATIWLNASPVADDGSDNSIYVESYDSSNSEYYRDDWSAYNLVLHKDAELDRTFIVTGSINGTTYTYASSYLFDANYTWASVCTVGDDGETLTPYSK